MKTNTFPLIEGSRACTATPSAAYFRIPASESFYKYLETQTDKILSAGKKRFSNLIDQFEGSFHAYTLQKNLTADEAILDILIMGVMWNVYKGQWGNSSLRNTERAFKKLYQLQSTHPENIGKIEQLRSKLSKRVLNNPGFTTGEHSLEKLKLLCIWLSATREFSEEASRMYPWIRFFETVPSSLVEQSLGEMIDFANWFDMETHREYRIFSTTINGLSKPFNRTEKGRDKKYRTGREEVEYHLNLVGSAILNRSMRNSFAGSKHQIVFLPGSLAKSENCQSVEILKGSVCSNCTAGCEISKISLELKELGIYTFIINDSSGISEYLNKWANQKEVGIVGVYHALDLLTISLEMSRLNIPAQSIALEYNLCKQLLVNPDKRVVVNPSFRIQKSFSYSEVN